MSLILDALKKLDREKSSRRERTGNIASGILRPDPPRPERKRFLYLGAASVSALAAALTYGVMEYGFPVKTATLNRLPAAAVNPPVAKQQVAAALPLREPAREGRQELKPAPAKPEPPSQAPAQPVSPAPASREANAIAAKPAAAVAEAAATAAKPAAAVSPPPAAASPSPAAASPPGAAAPLPRREQAAAAPDSRETAPAARDSRDPAPAAPAETRGAPAKNQNPPEVKSAAVTPAEKRPPQRTVAEAPPVALPAPAKPADPAQAGLPGDPPSLKLSGIVWHEDPSARRAVVNGTFATEGSVIEGVKVVEIHPNRVTFSHNGRPFEIVMFR